MGQFYWDRWGLEWQFISVNSNLQVLYKYHWSLDTNQQCADDTGQWTDCSEATVMVRLQRLDQLMKTTRMKGCCSIDRASATKDATSQFVTQPCMATPPETAMSQACSQYTHTITFKHNSCTYHFHGDCDENVYYTHHYFHSNSL